MKLGGIHYAFIMATGLAVGGVGIADYVMKKPAANANHPTTSAAKAPAVIASAPQGQEEEVDRVLAADCVAHLTVAEAISTSTDEKVIANRKGATKYFMTALSTAPVESGDEKDPSKLIDEQTGKILEGLKKDVGAATKSFGTRLETCGAIYLQNRP